MQKTMRQFLSLGIAFILGLSLFGCGNGSVSASDGQSGNASTPDAPIESQSNDLEADETGEMPEGVGAPGFGSAIEEAEDISSEIGVDDLEAMQTEFAKEAALRGWHITSIKMSNDERARGFYLTPGRTFQEAYEVRYPQLYIGESANAERTGDNSLYQWVSVDNMGTDVGAYSGPFLGFDNIPYASEFEEYIVRW